MEKRIELEKRGRAANQITELNLDNCRSTNIVGLTDDFTALEALSLINVGLTTLKGFPKLPNLTRLELSDNRISSGLSNLSTSPKLTHLNISGNKIKDLEELKALENFKSLQVLDLFNNEATSIDSYREKIFALIPSLKYLDGFDANEEEALTDGEDDDELNGNGSEGDDGDAFCINGMEIDLKELDLFGQRLKLKRQSKIDADKNKRCDRSNDDGNPRPVDSSEIDEIDEYLTQLAIEIKARPSATSETCRIHNNRKTNSSPLAANDGEGTADAAVKEVSVLASSPQPSQPHLPYPVLMYWFMSIIFFVNTVKHTVKPTFSDEMGDDDDDDDDDGDEEEDDDDEEDCGEVSLAEVYNDDLEEDNSDYVEDAEGEDGEGEGEDEDEIDSDDDEAAAAAPAANNRAPEEAAEEESPARGKKRKHDV